MSENPKPINRTFNNLKTQDKKTNKGQTVKELSNRSAGIVVVRKNEKDELLVLLMRAYNYWDFPKGKIEIGERVIDAAIRETGEEAGIHKLDFVWGRDHTQTLPYGIIQKISYYFLAETQESTIVMQANPESGLPEHEEYRWLTFKEAHELVVPRISDVLDWAQEKIHNLTPNYLAVIAERPSLAKELNKKPVQKTSANTTSNKTNKVNAANEKSARTSKSVLPNQAKDGFNKQKTTSSTAARPVSNNEKSLKEANSNLLNISKIASAMATSSKKNKPASRSSTPNNTPNTISNINATPTTYLSMKGRVGASNKDGERKELNYNASITPVEVLDGLRPTNIPSKFKKTPLAGLKRK